MKHRSAGRAGDLADARDGRPDLVEIQSQKGHEIELRQRESILRKRKKAAVAA